MFSSDSSYNAFSFTQNNTTMPGASFTNDENPSSTTEDQYNPSASVSPFFQFPLLFLDDDGLLMSQLLSHHQHQILGSGSNIMAADADQITDSQTQTKGISKKVTTKKKRSTAGDGVKQTVPRKRTGKKDRHSKIYTSRGPRDRRMRLSLQIARKFFDLQDMLGFDKASKTIEWLFSKSKPAIKELADNLPGSNGRKQSCNGGAKSASYTSESEVVSGGAKETEINGDLKEARTTKERKSRKATLNPVPRESRDKARARARERTKEKMKMKSLQKSKHGSDEANPNDLDELQSSSPVETGENLQGSSSQTTSSVLKLVAEEEEEAHHNACLPSDHQIDYSISIMEKFLGISSATKSLSMFNCSLNTPDSSGANYEGNYPVFNDNWSMMNNERVQVQNSYCGMTNMKGSTGNMRVQSPSSVFMANHPNAEAQKSISIFMTTSNTHYHEHNPSSAFIINSNAKDQVNPNSVFMIPPNALEGNPTNSVMMSTSNSGLHSHFQGNHFSCNPIVSNKHRNFY